MYENLSGLEALRFALTKRQVELKLFRKCIYNPPFMIRPFIILSSFFLWVFASVYTLASEKVVLAHYMPWYSTNPELGEWGWHWTMDHTDPSEVGWNGKRTIASHDYPLIGLYDSGDILVLECQVQQMKLAGIDGVVIDWYGIHDLNDYRIIHENTKKLVSVIKRAGLQFAICFEDRAILEAVKKGMIKESVAINRGRESIQWIAQNWFLEDAYVQINGKPILLVFGPLALNDGKLKKAVEKIDPKPVTFSLHHLTKSGEGDSSFAWPPVDGGKRLSENGWKKSLQNIYDTGSERLNPIPIAFPAYRDFYQNAGIGKSYGSIPDRDGQTWKDSLDLAISQSSPIIQLATWNDYGEGTVIEPTTSLGYRYLYELSLKIGSQVKEGDLALPAELLTLRKRTKENVQIQELLNQASDCIFSSRIEEAELIIKKVKEEEKNLPAYFENGPVMTDPEYRFYSDIQYRESIPQNQTEYQKLRCRLDVYGPVEGNKNPVVIWFHGGGISRGNRTIPLPLRKKGMVVVSANYRFSPRIKSPAYVEDAAAVVAWTLKNIENYGGSTNGIFVSGHSAGGYLASMVGLDSKYLKAFGCSPDQLAGLVPFSGHTITHFTVRKERGIPWSQVVVDEMGPLFHVNKNTPPILLITGDRELELFGRYEETAYFWRMMKKVGNPAVFLREIKGFDHGGMPKPAFPLLLDFVQVCLSKKK